MLGRRTFVALVGGTVLVRTFALRAEPAHATPIVGALMGLTDDKEMQARCKAFEAGLKAEGWSIGQNLHIEYRFANADSELTQAYANELVGMRCDCILGHSTPVIEALKRATSTIPIVFVSVSDPIGSGFVTSMAHPGGNITGFTLLQATITGKFLSLLRDLTANLRQVALMYNPQSVPGATTFFMPAFIASAVESKVEPIVAPVNSAADIASAMASLASRPGGALITVPDNFLSLHRDLIIALAAKYSIPAIYPYRYFAEAGGLASYGVDAVDLFGRATDYVSRILRGAKPADLPVQGPTKFEMVVNLRTARALGLAVPKILLASADAVIE
jgi:putative tryptophan/tyrosine transport system substrate-binding protein